MVAFVISAGPEQVTSRGRDATQARAREATALKASGLSFAAIAARLGIGERRVRQYLHGPHMVPDAEAPAEPGADGEGAAVWKRVRRGTFLDRAVSAIDSDRRLRTLERGLRMLWQECAVLIHTLGGPDGFQFGRDGFADLAEFVKAHTGSDDEMEALFRHQVLELLDEDAGLALPESLGLKSGALKKPSARRRARDAPEAEGVRPTPEARSARTPAAGQRSFTEGGFHHEVPVSSGRDFGGEISKISENFGAEVSKIGGEISKIGGQVFTDQADSVEIAGNLSTARASVSVAVVSSRETLSLENNSNSRAHAGLADPDISGSALLTFPSGASGDGDFEISSAPADGHPNLSPFVELAAELARLAKLGREPRADEVGLVEGWLGEHTPGAIRAVVLAVMKQPNTVPSSLKYFVKAMRDAGNGRKATAGGEPRSAAPVSTPVPAPAPTLSAEEQALEARLRAPQIAWGRDMHGCPFAPEPRAYKAEATAAYQWLD